MNNQTEQTKELSAEEFLKSKKRLLISFIGGRTLKHWRRQDIWNTSARCVIDEVH